MTAKKIIRKTPPKTTKVAPKATKAAPKTTKAAPKAAAKTTSKPKPVKSAPTKTSKKTLTTKKEKTEPKPRAPRKKVTLETYNQKIEELLVILTEEIDRRSKERGKGTRIFRTIRKHVTALKKDAPKLAKAKRNNQNNSNKVSGFSLQCEITEELAKFLKLEIDSTPTRKEITNGICAYINYKKNEERPCMTMWNHLNPGGKRDLQNPKDRMAILPNAALRKLLRYDDYINDVEEGDVLKSHTNKETGVKSKIVETDSALKYYVIQKLLNKHHILNTLKQGPTPVEID